MKKNIILIIIGVIILFLLALLLPPRQITSPTDDSTTDTSSQDIQATAPSDDGTTTGSSDITFAYPDALTTKYITSQDWPPQVQVTKTPYGCTPSGTETSATGKTKERTINNQVYCVTTADQGTAGSTYKTYTYETYTYETMLGDDNINIQFTMQFPDCANYQEADMTACTAEEASFNADTLVDTIIQSAQPVTG